MKNKEYTLGIISYIERNLNGVINIENISNCQYVSTMQLYRDFYNMTGHSVKEYVRKRRLSNALALVKHSEMSLTDIAYSCGYSSQQAFCKCVKAATGQTPLEYKSSESYYYFPTFSSERKYHIFVGAERIPQTLCMKYYHSQLRGIENRAVNYLMSLLPDFRGRMFGRNGKQKGNQFCYELSVEYGGWDTGLLKSSEFRDIVLISSGTAVFAKTAVRNIDQEVNEAWDHLYMDWLNTSMFEQADMNYFEEYLYKNGKVKRLVLYLPVKERKEYNKIKLKTCEDMIFLVSKRSGVSAEENASKAVLEFMGSYYPSLMKTTKTFYVAKSGIQYTCGVKLEKELHLPQDSEVEILYVNGGNYAILEGDCCGDSSVYVNFLLSWVKETGFEIDYNTVFTIYETDGSYEQENIKTRIHVKLKKC